jgi:hypothetical protein
MRRIFIIGFPKSGNTWLTRLVARAYHFPVAKFAVKKENLEMAADVNKEIENLNDNFRVIKNHCLPEMIQERFGDISNDIIIYVSRNPLDAFISSFFYFKHPRKDKFTRLDKNFYLNPVYKVLQLYYRRKLNAYIDEYLKIGIGKIKTLPYFHNCWTSKATQKSYKPVYVIYDDLINDPFSTLKSTFQKLDIPTPSDEDIMSAIDAEDFQKRKKAVSQNGDGLTFGKRFNVFFLRSGKSGDHKNHLTDKQIDYFNDLYSKQEKEG